MNKQYYNLSAISTSSISRPSRERHADTRFDDQIIFDFRWQGAGERSVCIQLLALEQFLCVLDSEGFQMGVCLPPQSISRFALIDVSIRLQMLLTAKAY